MSFCSPSRTKLSGVVVLSGPNLVQVVDELSKQKHIQILSNFTTIDNNNVPTFNTLSEMAVSYATSGHPTVLAYRHLDPLFNAIPKVLNSVPNLLILLYKPLDSILQDSIDITPEKAAVTLINLAMNYQGKTKSNNKTVAFLPKSDLVPFYRIMEQAPKWGNELSSLVQNFVNPMLFTSSTFITKRGNKEEGIYIEPKNGYAVDVSNMNQAVSQVMKLLKTLSSRTPSRETIYDNLHRLKCSNCYEIVHERIGSPSSVPCGLCLRNVQQAILGASNIAKVPIEVRLNSIPHYLVTGGCGFIGSHLVDLLLNSGYKVTVVDNLSTGKRHNIPESHPNLKVHLMEVSQFTDIYRPDRFGVFEGIVHLAATPAVGLSWDKPLEVHHNNLSLTLSVVHMAKQYKIPRVVFASSAATYGEAKPPLKEHQAIQPISPYGLQKLASEHYGRLFASNGGAQFVALRFFNVYGPRQDPKSQYSGVISVFVDRIRANRPITIYGDGNQTRDFVYVKDIAQTLKRALQMPMNDPFEAINTATGQVTSILQLAQSIAEVLPGHSLQVQFQSAQVGDIRHSLADITKLQQMMNGWKPATPLIEGLRELVQWNSSQH